MERADNIITREPRYDHIAIHSVWILAPLPHFDPVTSLDFVCHRSAHFRSVLALAIAHPIIKPVAIACHLAYSD